MGRNEIAIKGGAYVTRATTLAPATKPRGVQSDRVPRLRGCTRRDTSVFDAITDDFGFMQQRICFKDAEKGLFWAILGAFMGRGMGMVVVGKINAVERRKSVGPCWGCGGGGCARPRRLASCQSEHTVNTRW